MKTMLRERYWKWRFGRTAAGILRSQPLSCKSDAQTEVHTLLGHSGVFLYLASVKSLLRFYCEFAVVVHDDGSLTFRDRAILTTHVQGIRIIEKKEADVFMGEQLKGYPECRRYRQARIIALQLLDYWAISHAEKIISLDSDTLFLKPPDQLIRWVRGDFSGIVYSHEATPYDPTKALIRHGGIQCLNGGFLCFPRQAVGYGAIESILRDEPSLTWWTGQCCYGIVCGRWQGGAQAFDPALYQTVKSLRPGAVFRHYFASSNSIAAYSSDLKMVIRELRML